MQTPFYSIFLFAAALAVIEFYALKTRVGFKNELVAKYYLYQVVIGLLTIAFITAAPLNIISPTLQYVMSMILIIANAIIGFVLGKKKNAISK